ncbi:hypothetical protein PIB30_009670 [Stylosanthes scabra]|uniref:Uncharacterized protein n=1 Tax=Stylosanthes scabra TaxID=79078 RepID=A0ABU6U7T7_9FABA|nr:hypothetical protein [Stylosanthes scabra]
MQQGVAVKIYRIKLLVQTVDNIPNRGYTSETDYQTSNIHFRSTHNENNREEKSRTTDIVPVNDDECTQPSYLRMTPQFIAGNESKRVRYGAASGLDRSTPYRRNPHRISYLQTDGAKVSTSLDLQPGTEPNSPAATTPFNLLQPADDSVQHWFRPYLNEQDDDQGSITNRDGESQVPTTNDLFAGVVDDSSQQSVGEAADDDSRLHRVVDGDGSSCN